MSETNIVNLNRRLQQLNKKIDQHLTRVPKTRIKNSAQHNHTLPIVFSGIICAVYAALAFTNNLPLMNSLGNTAVWIWAAVAITIIGAIIVWKEH